MVEKTSEYHRNATRKDFLVVSGKSEMVLLHHKNQCSSMAGNKGIPQTQRRFFLGKVIQLGIFQHTMKLIRHLMAYQGFISG